MENVLALLPYLACPVGMGLMMWFMGRASSTQGAQHTPSSETAVGQTSSNASGDAASVAGATGTRGTAGERLAHLHSELQELQAQQTAIAGQIERLSAQDAPAVPAGRR